MAIVDSDRTTVGLLASGSLAGVLEIAGVFGVAAVVLAAGRPFVGDDPLKFQALVWVANVCMLGAVWLGLRRRRQGWSHLGLGPLTGGGRSLWGTAWKSLVVFVVAMAAFLLAAVVMAVLFGRPAPADFSDYAYLSGNLPLLLAALAAVFLVSSLGEEVLYRGFLITRLEELGGGSKRALWGAVVVSSAVFGLIHFAWGLAGMVQTAFMGLALGIAFLKVERDLWILVLAHVYLDAILMVQMYLAPPS